MSGTLPTWLDRYFGVPSGTAGEGTVWRLDHSWPLVAWLTLLAVATVIARVVVPVYIRDRRAPAVSAASCWLGFA